jgi:hypothetical protein
MPGWSYPVWRAAENLLSPWMNTWAMFAGIVLERTAFDTMVATADKI